MLQQLQDLRRQTSEEGFTLIELMITVVIIGILAAIALVIFGTQQAHAVGATLKNDVSSTNKEVAAQLAKSGTSTTLSEVAPTVTDGNAVSVSGTWDNYSVVATNVNGNPTCWEFKSTTGKAAECAAAEAETPQAGGNFMSWLSNISKELSDRQRSGASEDDLENYRGSESYSAYQAGTLDGIYTYKPYPNPTDDVIERSSEYGTVSIPANSYCFEYQLTASSPLMLMCNGTNIGRVG